MNIERNNFWLNGGVALAIGLIMSSCIFGWFYSNAKKGDEAIMVTGSAKRRIKSDLVVWSAGVTTQSASVTDAYARLSQEMLKIKQYLIGKGIPEEQMTVSAISAVPIKRTDSDGRETQEVIAYSLSQHIGIRSTDVEKISQIAREATELLNQGILIESSVPQFYYTKIGDLKVEMLGEAAKDAKERAEKIAGSTGNSIGAVRSARMGVLQITPPDSTDVSDSGMYSTETIDKDITAVVNISFAVS
ncbi:MAG: SIMPL domain-containing protein [Pyrinomonadaceae bacterium]